MNFLTNIFKTHVLAKPVFIHQVHVFTRGKLDYAEKILHHPSLLFFTKHTPSNRKSLAQEIHA